MDRNQEFDNAIQQWLEEHPEDEDAQPRAYLGESRRYDLDAAPEHDREEIDERKRQKARAFSLRFGWIYDLFECLYYAILEWFTVDVVSGVMRGLYGLVMFLLVYAIFHYSSEAIRLKQAEREQPLNIPAEHTTEGSP